MTMRKRVLSVPLWLAAAMVWSVVDGSSSCEEMHSCSSCLEDPSCVWCDHLKNLTVRGGRCMYDRDQRFFDCDEKDIHRSVHDSMAEECSFNGIYKCGECHCNKGYIGNHCECEMNMFGDEGDINESACRATPTSAVCSNRGTCSCGACLCNERIVSNEVISGPFCECTNFLCNRHNGQLCGGPEHGECVCNECVCRPGWAGEDCTCEESKDNCLEPVTGEVCSGNGVCECNKCKCYEKYSGKYCEDCPICPGSCNVYKQCVECQIFRNGELTSQECMEKCSAFNITAVTRIGPTPLSRVCSFFDENSCRYVFAYYVGTKPPEILVQANLECPPGIRTSSTAEKSSGYQTSTPHHYYFLILSVTLVLFGTLIGCA